MSFEKHNLIKTLHIFLKKKYNNILLVFVGGVAKKFFTPFVKMAANNSTIAPVRHNENIVSFITYSLGK